MKKLDRILSQAIAQKETLRNARANKVLKQWNEIVGEKLSEKSWPDNFENGIAYVAVEGSAWAQELRALKEKLLKRINEKAGEPGLVTDLRFGTRKLPAKASTKPKKKAIDPATQPKSPKEFKDKWIESPNREKGT